jgi:hypothetical protein
MEVEKCVCVSHKSDAKKRLAAHRVFFPSIFSNIFPKEMCFTSKEKNSITEHNAHHFCTARNHRHREKRHEKKNQSTQLRKTKNKKKERVADGCCLFHGRKWQTHVSSVSTHGTAARHGRH